MGLPRFYNGYISYDMNEKKPKLNPSANLHIPNINPHGFKAGDLVSLPPVPPPPVPSPPVPPAPPEAAIPNLPPKSPKKIIKSEVQASLSETIGVKTKPSGLLMFFDLLIIGVSISLSIYLYFWHT